jgi:hypothetical protein
VDDQTWLNATDPQVLLDLLRRNGRPDERKWLLLAAACCRQHWHLLDGAALRSCVEVAERWADGEATHGERMAAHAAAVKWATGIWKGVRIDPHTRAVGFLATVQWAMVVVALAQGGEEEHAARVALSAAARQGQRPQAATLRCLFGNPFHRVQVDPLWLTGQDGLIPRLAKGCYDSRDFSGMPVLADALEEAGCCDLATLEHCRQPGEHHRGCLVVDAILGKT